VLAGVLAGLGAAGLPVDASPSPTAPLPGANSFPDTVVDERSVETVTVVDVPGSTPTAVVDGAGFALAGIECVSGDGADTCEISIVFAPDAPGEFFGTLTVTASDTTQTSNLGGVGIEAPTTVPPPTGPTTTVSPSTAPPTSDDSDQVPTSDDSAPTTTPVDQNPDLATLAEECQRMAVDALVRYPPAIEMTVGRPTTVVVTVDMADTAPTVTDATPDTVVDSAVLTCFVEARLSGNNFDIDQPTQPGDFVLEPSIRWEWEVVPRSTGRHQLDLLIIPKIQTSEDILDGTPRPFTADITVLAAPRSRWEAITDFVSDLIQNPFFQLAVAAGFLSAIGASTRKWFGAAMARRRSSRPGDDEHDGYL